MTRLRKDLDEVLPEPFFPLGWKDLDEEIFPEPLFSLRWKYFDEIFPKPPP